MKKSIFLLFLVILMCISLIACGTKSETSNTVSSVSEVSDLDNSSEEKNTSSTESSLNNESSVADSKETTESQTSPFEKMYEAGKYKVGTDFDAGTYILLAEEGGYFSVSSDANGDDILFNDNFDNNSLIEVYDGEFIDLSRCIAIDMEEFYSAYTVDTEQNGGTFRVGYDIEPGEYKLVADGNSGYYCIYADLRQDNIVANDNFDNATYVELKEGEYILLSRCKFSSAESIVAEKEDDSQAPYSKMYEAGTYKVGTDFDAGTYILLAEEGGYYSVSSDANGDNILFNDNFNYDALIEVRDGEYIKFSRCIAVDMEEFYSTETNNIEQVGGMFRVGYDIPAGEYKLKAESDRGYYCIYEDLRQETIIANDNFENSTYVEIKDGQYLVLSRCAIVK